MVTDESPTTRRAKLVGGYLGILAVLLLIGLPLFWILMTSFKAQGRYLYRSGQLAAAGMGD